MHNEVWRSALIVPRVRDPVAVPHVPLQASLAAPYHDLVTRRTGLLVRTLIEPQLEGLADGSVAFLDFSRIGMLDRSCADEFVAKLMLPLTQEHPARNGYVVLHGVNEGRRVIPAAAVPRCRRRTPRGKRSLRRSGRPRTGPAPCRRDPGEPARSEVLPVAVPEVLFREFTIPARTGFWWTYRTSARRYVSWATTNERKAALEDVSVTRLPRVAPRGESERGVLDDSGERDVAGSDDEMDVNRHQAEGEDLVAEAFALQSDSGVVGSCPGTVTRVYRVTDECGNYKDGTQTHRGR